MSSCRRRKLPVALWHQVQAELKNNKKKNYKNNPNSFIKTVTSNEFITALYNKQTDYPIFQRHSVWVILYITIIFLNMTFNGIFKCQTPCVLLLYVLFLI